jgi:hypothetical protein
MAERGYFLRAKKKGNMRTLAARGEVVAGMGAGGQGVRGEVEARGGRGRVRRRESGSCPVVGAVE